MKSDIEEFLMHLATERGLSERYQLLVQYSLDIFLGWVEKTRQCVTGSPSSRHRSPTF